jgi:hypothetical protein
MMVHFYRPAIQIAAVEKLNPFVVASSFLMGGAADKQKGKQNRFYKTFDWP